MDPNVDVSPCRWAATFQDTAAASTQLVDLAPNEQLSRGQELLRLLREPVTPRAVAEPALAPPVTASTPQDCQGHKLFDSSFDLSDASTDTPREPNEYFSAHEVPETLIADIMPGGIEDAPRYEPASHRQDANVDNTWNYAPPAHGHMSTHEHVPRLLVPSSFGATQTPYTCLGFNYHAWPSPCQWAAPPTMGETATTNSLA